MKKNLFTIIVLILIVLGSCIKKNKDNPQQEILVEEKDAVETDTIDQLTIDEIIEEAGRNLQLDFMEDEKNKVVLLQLNPGHAFIGPGNTLHRSPPNPTCEERLLVAVSMEKSLATVTTH